jgi:hypothetical protein
MKKTLTETDYQKAAIELGCEVAAIKAVAEVESAGGGFLSSGEPKILFERHWMHRLMRTKGMTPPTNQPDIVSTKSGGYIGGQSEHVRLQRAVLIDRESAIMSC